MRLPHLLLFCMIFSATPLSCCGRRATGIVVTTDAGTSYKVLSEGTIFVGGKQGLLIKYEAAVIDEPKNLSEARELFQVYRSHAESRGLQLVAITALVSDKRIGPFHSSKTYTSVFERGTDGRWTAVPPRAGGAAAPAASSSAANDAGLGTHD